MPHRATYIFPRQFPDNRGFSLSSSSSPTISSANHEKKTKKSDDDNNNNVIKSSFNSSINESDDERELLVNKITGANYNNFDSNNKKKLAAFYSWLAADRKKKKDGGVYPQLSVSSSGKERGFDRQVSFARLSSCGSSYGDGSFFSSEVQESHSTEEEEICEEREGKSEKSLAEKARESYYLQLSLAKRLGSQASEATLGNEPSMLFFDTGPQGQGLCSDAETVSYRLWVNGCLSYTDKISDGFYNILGLNPHVWVMCNDFDEGRQIPSLTSLKAISPGDTPMEVVLLDKFADSRLKELQDRAKELSKASQNTVGLVEQLGKLVSVHMGGDFPVEQGDLHRQWETVSKRLKDLHNCVVLLIGSLSSGLCRHRAILFKNLADCVGLPCRIAQGCRYCVADHRSSCLVVIEDERQLPREYVVDLVCKPGKVHSPDASINGGLLSSVPSPFQVSRLKDYKKPYVHIESSAPLSKCTCASPGPLSPGSYKGDWHSKNGCHMNVGKSHLYNPLDRCCVGIDSPMAPSVLENPQPLITHRTDFLAVQTTVPEAIGGPAGVAMDGYSSLSVDQFGQHNYTKEMGVSNPFIGNAVKQAITDISQPVIKEVDNKVEKQCVFSTSTIPRYVDLEPSLAMDWLEISWDELHLKERVGAGSFGTVHRAEWHGSDVAVKVLTVQD